MVDFRKIRTVGTSQEDGFEEFVCQLARKEKIENAKRFVKLGNPDGGLECYWELEDGSKIGWQAKYFTDSISKSSRWNQMKESVKSALKNHSPKKIIFAIPHDPGNKGWKNLEKKIDEWKTLPEAKDKEFEIEFWFEHDLISRLQYPENEGFVKFWFDETYFTDKWFNDHAKATIENLGDKLDRTVKIDTNNKIYFDSICRNKDFEDYIYELMHKYIVHLKKQLNELSIFFESKNIDAKIIQDCLYLLDNIQKTVLAFDYDGMDDFDFESIQDTLNEIFRKIKSIKITFIDEKDEKTYSRYRNEINFTIDELDDEIYEDEVLKITNNPSILFYGEAGIGKSFLFGDIAENKIENNENLIFLLGEQFGLMRHPESIILDELTIREHSFDDFLDALECKAYANNSRMIIMIDAINEGKGIKLWDTYLKGFIEKISKRKSLALVLSVRDTFINKKDENDPSKLQIPFNKINAIELTGFEYVFEARIEFFKKYNIKFPNNYMMSPELDNPLFLKLFCESLYNNGYEIIPDNLDAFSKIMEFYIDSINSKLAKKFEYHPKINLLNDILNALVGFQIENNKPVTIESANSIIMDRASNYPFSHEILKELINEGLLQENNFINDSYIQITFQRLKDYLSVKHLMSDLSFKEDRDYIVDIVKNSPINLLEMFSIYIPENYNIEVYELLDDSDDENVIRCFIKSLKWRRESLDEKIFDYINNHVINTNARNEFLMALIDISTSENHLLNAYRTHKMLSSQNLPTRDAFWIPFLHHSYKSNSNINHLLEFGLLEDYSNYPNETIKLSAIMIGWFLATTNKKLRDKSTYAIANLLKNKLNILKELLELFEDVDDTYILERLYAAAYGCVLNSSNHEHMKDLSNYIYETIFNQETVYPHILIRDYARNIIEFSLSKNCEFDDDLSIIKEKITPPYNSKFPKIPTDEEIEKYKTENKGVKRIFSSMLVEYDREGNSLFYGDFGRYTFQSCFTMWTNELKKKNIYFMDLMNIALEKIFKFNYDEDLHGYFDEHTIGLYEREENSERIGKKYQWMALYELLAKVSDKFPLIDKDYISNEEIIPYQGPWQDNIRNIDPTITFANDLPKLELKFEEKYPSENFLKENWIEHSQDLPDFSEIIELNTEFDEKNINGLILEGNLNWTRQPDFGSEKYPKKEIWSQIRSYIVKPSTFNKIIPILKHKNFNGRWMPESHENHELFNKEFFQSVAYDYFYENGLDEKDEATINNKKYNLNVTTSKYSGSERSSIANNNYLKVNNSIFKKLNLKYGKKNSFIYDEYDNLIGFDAIEFNKSYNNNLIFDKKMLLKYIKDNNLKIFFTVLGEKMIINEWDSKLQTFSGVYYFKDDNLKGSVNPYTECNFEELETSIAGIVKKVEMNMNNTFKRNLYIDYENKISYLFIKTNLCEFNAKKEFITTEKINENEWAIYSLDKNKIGKNYLNTISNEISEIKDSYIIYCIINGNYYNIIISSNFKQANSNHSTLYQQFIKPLLLNMRLTNYTFKKPYPKSRQLCKLHVPEDHNDKIAALMSLIERSKYS